MTHDNKHIATEFLALVTRGDIDEAYDTYVDMSGKHHNVYFPGGFDVLKNAMKDAHVAMPHKIFTPKKVLCDGDMVAVHSSLVLSAEKPEMSVVHMFRIQNGKIVEMWDVGMEIPAKNPNTDGAF